MGVDVDQSSLEGNGFDSIASGADNVAGAFIPFKADEVQKDQLVEGAWDTLYALVGRGDDRGTALCLVLDKAAKVVTSEARLIAQHHGADGGHGLHRLHTNGNRASHALLPVWVYDALDWEITKFCPYGISLRPEDDDDLLRTGLDGDFCGAPDQRLAPKPDELLWLTETTGATGGEDHDCEGHGKF